MIKDSTYGGGLIVLVQRFLGSKVNFGTADAVRMCLESVPDLVCCKTEAVGENLGSHEKKCWDPQKKSECDSRLRQVVGVP